MLLLLRNCITEAYMESLVERGTLFKKIQLGETDYLEELNNQLMYYSKVNLYVTFMKDYRKISEILKYENTDIKLIISIRDIKEQTYMENLLKKKKKDFKVLSLRTIPKARCLVLIESVLTAKTMKTYDEDTLSLIYNHLQYSSKVDEELSLISKLRSKTALKEYLKQQRNIRSGNYVVHLLLGTKLTYLGNYLITNSSNINYIFKVLENFLRGYLEVYSSIIDGSLNVTNIQEFISAEENLDKNYLKTPLRQYLDVSKEVGFNYMYTLNIKVLDAKTRFEKQMVIKELVESANTN